jgi:hypothetical protein
MFKLNNVCKALLLFTAIGFCNSAVIADTSLISDAHSGGAGKGKAGQHGQGHGKAHSKAKANKLGSKKQKIKNTKTVNNARFGTNDKTAITKYYSANPFSTTTLPPGIAKNLLRGKPLPPGIQKVFLPEGLLSQLPVYPGYEYLAVGKDVVLIDSNTAIVADILANVLQ